MSQTLKQFLDDFEVTFNGLRETARLVLAVAATTRLERKQPLAVILVGGPSSGKTTILMPLTKGLEGSVISSQVIRVDDFSGASLVSHAANKTTEQLAKQDLLPRLKHMCLIVKEMAPTFTGNEDELMRKFGVLASVLDGEGYTSSSGSHGQRGYTDPILFTLIGAVTPNVLSPKVLKCLDAVGPRFCFWEVPSREIDPAEWRGPDENRALTEKRVTQSLTEFIDDLFKKYSPGSVSRTQFHFSSENKEALSRIAVLMATLRSRGMVDKDDDGNNLGYQVSSESPERAYRYLEQIVLGSALIANRFKITNQDLQLALGIAIGSAPPSRRKVIRALIESGGKMTVRELSITMNISTDTAMGYAIYTEKLGIIEKVNFDGTSVWDLKEAFRCMRYIHNPNLVPDEPTQNLWKDM